MIDTYCLFRNSKVRDIVYFTNLIFPYFEISLHICNGKNFLIDTAYVKSEKSRLLQIDLSFMILIVVKKLFNAPRKVQSESKQ